MRWLERRYTRVVVPGYRRARRASTPDGVAFIFDGSAANLEPLRDGEAANHARWPLWSIGHDTPASTAISPAITAVLTCDGCGNGCGMRRLMADLEVVELMVIGVAEVVVQLSLALTDAPSVAAMATTMVTMDRTVRTRARTRARARARARLWARDRASRVTASDIRLGCPALPPGALPPPPLPPCGARGGGPEIEHESWSGEDGG